MRRTTLVLYAAVLAATLTGCNDGSYGPAAASSQSAAAASSQSAAAAAKQETSASFSTPAAPTSAASSAEAPTTAPAPSSEPAPETTTAAPAPSTAPEQVSLAATVEDAIDQGGIGRPTWAAPITEVEELDAQSVRLHYQESVPTEAAAAALATKVYRFTRAEGAQLDTIVIRDTSGVDTNVYCGQTICSTDLLETDH